MVQSCPVSNVMKKTSSLALFLKPQSWEPCNYLLTELPVLFFKCLAPCNCRKSQKHYSSAPYSFKTKPLKTTMYRHCFLKKYPTLRAHQPYALHSLRHQQMTAGTAVLVWSSRMYQQSLGRWTREGCKPRNQLGSRRSRQRHQTPSSRDSHPEKGKTTTTCKVGPQTSPFQAGLRAQTPQTKNPQPCNPPASPSLSYQSSCCSQRLVPTAIPGCPSSPSKLQWLHCRRDLCKAKRPPQKITSGSSSGEAAL